VQLAAGELTEFVYDVRAGFGGTGQAGFDAIRFLTPSTGRFLSLEIGEPLVLVEVEPNDVVSEENGFVVYLPQRVEQGGADRLRIRLETAVYGASERLRAEVFERGGDTLPQEVEAGDASAALGTNDLRVLALEASPGLILGDISVDPAVLTPQGGGVNDEAEIEYVLFQILEKAEVEVKVFKLSGERVRRLSLHTQEAGRYSVCWDGRDDRGQVVTPGIYLARVEVNTDTGKQARTLPIAVAY